jgi:hypothetical protein
MVDRRVGRTEGPEVGHGRSEPRRAPEPQNGDVREPRAPLTLVDPQGLQAVEQPPREAAALPRRVVEDEHADAARLAVPARREHDLPSVSRGRLEGDRDRRQLGGRPATEEGERDVEMLAGNDPPVAEMLALPGANPVEDVVGQTEAAEEA